MGDAAGERAARDLADRWNDMLDSLDEYQRGEASAEEFADLTIRYVMAVGRLRITRREQDK